MTDRERYDLALRQQQDHRDHVRCFALFQRGGTVPLAVRKGAARYWAARRARPGHRGEVVDIAAARRGRGGTEGRS